MQNTSWIRGTIACPLIILYIYWNVWTKIRCYYHTNSYIPKHFNNTNRLFQKKAPVNTTPYFSWFKTYPIRHAIREKPVNNRCNITSSILTLLESGHITEYVYKYFIISRRTYRILWNNLCFFCFNIDIFYYNLLQHFDILYTIIY